MGHALMELESRLVAEPSQRVCTDVSNDGLARQCGDRCQRRDATLEESLRIDTPHSRDDRRVIVVASSLDARRIPHADPAVIDRVGVRVDRSRTAEHPGLESRLCVAVVGRVVLQAMRMFDAVARHDIDGFRLYALEPLEEVGVDAHLDDGRGFDTA